MRNIFPFLAAVAFAGVLASGCTSAQKKLGRGFSNSAEFARLGEIQRDMEQTALFDTPGDGHNYTYGFIRGFTKSVARTGVGVYEVVTAPLPPYGPVLTDYLSPNPVYPASYRPGLIEDSSFSTDVNLGFSGGDVAPFIPGSRFRVFDTH